MQDLPEALARQLKLNRRKNLLHSRAEQLLELEPTFVAALERLIGSSTDEAGSFNAEDLAVEAADRLIERIQAVNQYIQVDEPARNALVGIYLDSWKRLMKTRNIEQTLRTFHYPGDPEGPRGSLSRRAAERSAIGKGSGSGPQQRILRGASDAAAQARSLADQGAHPGPGLRAIRPPGAPTAGRASRRPRH